MIRAKRTGRRRWPPAVVPLLLAIVFVAGVSRAGSARLPAWFWTPPSGSEVECRVGYAGEYEHPESSYREAFEDAARRLWRDRCCRIEVRSGALTLHGETMSLDIGYRITADTADFAAFRETLVRLDSCWTDSLVVMLVGTDRIELDRRMIEAPPLPVEFHGTAGVGYGIGAAPAYYHGTSSWREAELGARLDLALNANSTLDVRRRLRDKLYGNLTVRSAGVVAREITVLQRFYDRERGHYMVIVATDRTAIRPTRGIPEGRGLNEKGGNPARQ